MQRIDRAGCVDYAGGQGNFALAVAQLVDRDVFRGVIEVDPDDVLVLEGQDVGRGFAGVVLVYTCLNNR